MPTFPTFSLGEAVHLPFTQVPEFMNAVNRMPHGWQYAYNLRATPLRRWRSEFLLSDADLITLPAEIDMHDHPDYVHVAAATIREKVRRMVAARKRVY